MRARASLRLPDGRHLRLPQAQRPRPWTLHVLALVFVAKAVSMTPTPVATAGMPPHSEPRSILDARYAKGEITRDEYLRMRADLDGPPH